MISVIVPTVPGREQHLEACLAAYDRHTAGHEVHVIPGRSTCGQAWLDGADLATGDILHFSADDLEPHHGWWQAAQHVTDTGFLPAPRILKADGTLETCGGSDGFAELPTGHRTDFTRIPFLTRSQWEQIRPLIEDFLVGAHYFTDNAVSWAAARAGVGTVVHRGYLFTHHWAQAGRGAGMTENDRMRHDHAAFLQLIS